MEKLFRRIALSVFVILCALLAFNVSTSMKALAQSDLVSEDFIRKPTYSVFYDDKIYFVDDYDNNLKVYDLDTKEITYSASNHINETVVGANFDEKILYVLTKSDEFNTLNSIYSFNLQNGTKNIIDISDLQIDSDYKHIFVQSATVESQNYTLVSLSAKGKYPIILKIDEDDNIVKTGINYSAQNYILLSSMAYFNQNNSINIISVLFNNNNFVVTNGTITFDKLNGTDIETFMPSEFSLSEPDKLSFEGEILPLNATLSRFNDAINLIITYNEVISGQVNAGARLFKCEIGDSADTTLIFKDNISNPNELLISNGKYICFPNQQVNSICLIVYGEDYNSTINENCATNPEIEINYLSTNNVIYFQSKQGVNEIKFYNDPWQSKSNFDLIVENKVDLLQVATAQIVYSQSRNDVEDFIYCMYTADSTNYFGFVSKNLIETKAQINISDFEYKAKLKMKEGAKLYSLPTKISQEISQNFSSKLVSNINENALVDVVLTDGKTNSFTSNGTKWLKVQVNEAETGYIDCNYIVSTSKTINYIVPNATILENGTKVYISNSKNSQVSYTLKSGKRVKIIGARDSSTGLTEIMFNNEYGDEFTGYINSEQLKTDNWSTLQIIGCVLIAINVGLLILILLFKKKHLKVKDELFKTYSE